MTAARSHPCFMPSCDRIAHSEWAVCGDCHRVLPAKHRTAIGRAFVSGMTEESATPGLRMAIHAAHTWVRETFGDQSREKYDPGKWERLVRYVRERDEARAARHAAATPPPCPSRACRCPECVAKWGAGPRLRLVP